MVDSGTLDLIITALVGYAIGATIHIWIDYAHGKRMLRQYWDKTDVKIAGIEAEVIEGLKKEIPSSDIGTSLENWLRSPSGVSWAQEVGALAGSKAVEGIKQVMTSETGAQTRAGLSSAEKLANGVVDFENPYLNFIWMNLPPNLKHRAFGVMYRAFGKGIAGAAATAEAEDAEFENVPPSNGGQLIYLR